VIHPASKNRASNPGEQFIFFTMTLVKQPACSRANIMLSILYTSKYQEQKIQSPDQSVVRALQIKVLQDYKH